MVMIKAETQEKNWERLVSSLKKGFAEMEKEKKAGKKEQLMAVEVVCSHKDIEKTRRSWAKTKRK